MAHVFISYVREDSQSVERLCNSLRQSGVQLWIDRNNILPGTRWRRAIRKAINEGDYFIACFSPHYINRGTTFMNEELTIAIELLRKMPIERAWFIPVLLSECELPDREIGAGETLLDIQQVRLYEDWEAGIKQILAVIKLDDNVNTHVDDKAESNIISILFMTANPSDTGHLRLDEELREIQLALLKSELRDSFHLEVGMAVRLEDLQNALIRVKPRIVHFSGHGASTGELILEDDRRQSRHIDSATLAPLFKAVRDKVDCVVLNVAFSSKLAEVIAKEVKYVIGMRGAIRDQAAIAFSSGFYSALAFGRSIEDAFGIGCAQIDLLGLAGGDVPILVKKGE